MAITAKVTSQKKRRGEEDEGHARSDRPVLNRFTVFLSKGFRPLDVGRPELSAGVDLYDDNCHIPAPFPRRRARAAWVKNHASATASMKPQAPAVRLARGRMAVPHDKKDLPMAQSGSSTQKRNAADDLTNKAADLAERTGDRIERTVQDLADQGRQATEHVQVVAENFKTAVDKSVKDQPLTTLAVAAGIGFVIGALWKS